MLKIDYKIWTIIAKRFASGDLKERKTITEKRELVGKRACKNLFNKNVDNHVDPLNIVGGIEELHLAGNQRALEQNFYTDLALL